VIDDILAGMFRARGCPARLRDLCDWDPKLAASADGRLSPLV
jgi:hypothetical protein